MSDPQRAAISAEGPRKLAILIGIDAYHQGVPQLRNAVRDVQRVAQVLKDEHGYEVRLLLDAEAGRAALLDLLQALAEELGAADRFIFYFAGHGIAEEVDDTGSGPQGFLVPCDARRDDAGSFLAMSEVLRLLSRLPVRQLLVVLDCCFAGAFRWSRTRSLRPRPTTLYRERFERYLRDPAWQVLTSAAADERALDTIAGGKLGSREASGENSPFAAALCQGLSGAADLRLDGRPGDGIILASELHLYLESIFARLEQQLQRPVQKPMLWSISEGERDQGQFIFLTPGRAPVLPSALELNEQNNPYLGLRPFAARDQHLFFGRRAAVDSLYARVKEQALTIVIGASGTGKSSLVRAGLVPRLQRETSPPWLLLEPQRPGTDPLAMLAQLADKLQAGHRSLAAAVTEWAGRSAQTPLLLVIDQAEELVTLSAASRKPVLHELAQACAAGAGRLHLVLTLRSEFEPHFSELLPSDEAQAESARFLIPPMNRQELREAIEGPASERVLYFEPPELVEQLLDEVADMPGALPLLSFVLSEMYRRYVQEQRQDRSLRQHDYRVLGGVAGALAKRADAIYQGYASEAQRLSFRHLMLRMVVPGELARRRVTSAELDFPDREEQARVDRIREDLLQARLLVSDRDSRGRDFVEPAHDKLVMGWPQLGRFLAEDKQHVLHFGLIEDSQTWEESRRDGAELWDRDARLPQAVSLYKNSPARLNRMETDFVLQSTRSRRLRIGIVLAMTLTALGLLGVWLIRERQHSARLERDRQRIQEESLRAQQANLAEQALRSETLGALPGHETEARFLALEAYTKSLQAGFKSIPQVEASLAAAASSSAFRLRLQHGRGRLTEAWFSPAGKQIITVSPEAGIQLWDAMTGQPQRGLPDNATQAAFSTSELLVTNSGRTWNVNRGSCTRLPQALMAPEDVDPQSAWITRNGSKLVHFHSRGSALHATVYGLAPYQRLVRLLVAEGTDTVTLAGFSPAGRYVLAYPTGTGRLLSWNVPSGDPGPAPVRIQTIGGDHQGLREAVFSPDEKLILTGSENTPASLFSAQTGRLLRELKGPLYAVDHVAFASAGDVFLTVGGRHVHGEESRRGKRQGAQDVRLWDRDEQNQEPDWIRVQSELRGSGAATFSQDGAYVAVVQGRESIQIRQTADLELTATLRGHALSHDADDGVRLAFSPDARQLVSYSVAESSEQAPVILVWDIAARPKPASATEAVRTVCRLLRYEPQWSQHPLVHDTCTDAIKDLPAASPAGSEQRPASCR